MKKIRDNILKAIKEKGFRVTPQREKLFELFATAKGHFSAEEIYELSRRKNLDISLATIYRNIDLLKKTGIIREEDFGDGRGRFEINIDHHHHLICVECGKVQELNDPMINEFEKKLEKNSKFTIKNHRLEFYGLCPKCRKRLG